MPPLQMRSRVSSTSAKYAVHGIDCVADVSRLLVELGAADHDPAGRPRALAQPRHQRGAIVLDAIGLLFE